MSFYADFFYEKCIQPTIALICRETKIVELITTKVGESRSVIELNKAKIKEIYYRNNNFR
jgi:hypothetical protein